ncbi:MAG TPA: hypothetical protein VIX19_09995 [Terriglobales bacterium]
MKNTLVGDLRIVHLDLVGLCEARRSYREQIDRCEHERTHIDSTTSLPFM